MITKILFVICCIILYLILGLLFVRCIMWPYIGNPESYDDLYNGLKRTGTKELKEGIKHLEESYEGTDVDNKQLLISIVEIIWTVVWIFLALMMIRSFIIGLFTKD